MEKNNIDNLGSVAYIDDGYAYVNFKRKSSCGDNCASCSGNCDVSSHLIRVQNNLNAKKGDLVLLSLSTDDFLKMSFLLYMIPLIVLAGSIISIYLVSKNDLISIFFGILSTLLSFLLINKYVLKKNKKGKLLIKMEKLIQAPEETRKINTL